MEEKKKQELALEEMAGVTGGEGGSPYMLAALPGYKAYLIRPGDTLGIIAKNAHTTEEHLLAVNPTLANKYEVTAGYFIYVPAR